MPPKAAKKYGEGIFWTDSPYFPPRFTALQGGGVHNPDPLRAQVWLFLTNLAHISEPLAVHRRIDASTFLGRRDDLPSIR